MSVLGLPDGFSKSPWRLIFFSLNFLNLLTKILEKLLFGALFCQLSEKSDPWLNNSIWVISLHNWLSPSIKNTTAGCHGKNSHQIAPRSMDIFTLLLPPLCACLNVFSAFLHVVSYLYSLTLYFHTHKAPPLPLLPLAEIGDFFCIWEQYWQITSVPGTCTKVLPDS